MVRNTGNPDMECVASGNDLVASPRRRAGKTAEAKEGRIARTNPRSRAINRSARAAEYAAFADALHLDLNPNGPLERLMADHVVQSAWQLKGALERKAARDLGGKADPDSDTAERSSRATPTATDRAARSVRDAVESFDFLRGRRPRLMAAPSLDSQAIETEIEPNEWPIVPFEGLEDDPIGPEPASDEIPNWR